MTKARNRRTLLTAILVRFGVTEKEMKFTPAADPELYIGQTTMTVRPRGSRGSNKGRPEK